MPAVPKTDRDAILKAAVSRLRNEGLAALSLRALAGDVGIATNALYHYFPSRSHLEDALSEQAATRLHAALQRATAKQANTTHANATDANAKHANATQANTRHANATDANAKRANATLAPARQAITPAAKARERILALAAGYLRFARREPHLYAAMIHGPCGTGEPQTAHNALWQFVCDAAAALHGAEHAESAAVSLWALLHGAVSLQQSGALAGKPSEGSITFGLNAWIHTR